MKQETKLIKAIANEKRLEILKILLKEGELKVGEIASRIGLSFKGTSKHLSVLDGADLIRKNKRGNFVFYTISKYSRDQKRKQIIKFVAEFLN